ncbi:diaminopimelate decarboxylase [Xylanibacillus composti]|nr:diaminopimelate decarboxylase [Xylanibacillus composti]
MIVGISEQVLPIDLYQRLGEQYGTPLYVYDMAVIEQRVADLRQCLHPNVRLFYSMKANPNPSVVRAIYRHGVYSEICSPLELEIALSAGIVPAHILYLGPGKSAAELERLVALGVRYLIVESIQEIALVQKIAGKRGMVAEVGLRINPRETVRGARLKMGGAARQFGIDEDQLPEVLAAARAMSCVRVVGLHGYLGTRILQADTIAANVRCMLEAADRLLAGGLSELRYVGVGGGFGIPYHSGESRLDLEAVALRTRPLFDSFLRRYPDVEVLAESGRFLVAEAGSYLVRVRYTKRSQGVEFAIADGGVHQFAAAGGAGSLVKRNYPIEALVCGRGEQRMYHISGPLCSPDDLIGRGVELPVLQPGDLLAVRQAGAYGLTFSPVLFLSHPLPREVMLANGQAVLVRDIDEYGLPAVREL